MSWAHAWLGYLPLVALPAFVISYREHLLAWVFMWALAFAIFAGLKWSTWWEARSLVPHGIGRSLAYLAAWPGMDAEAFLDSRRSSSRPLPREWLWALAKTVSGIVLLWVIARRTSPQLPLVQGWLGLVALVLLLHFGSFHLIALFWQTVGFVAEPIMQKPLLSKSLSEFWGKRWNLGFRHLAHNLIFRPLYKPIGVALAGLLVFVVSGLVHDLVISLPARGGYGLPTTYFLLQGLGVSLERSSLGELLGLRQGARGWCFMFLLAAGPAYWLFHPPFVLRVILPFMHAIGAL